MGNWKDSIEEHSLHLQNRRWMYRGEGNANLVFSLPDNGVILRLHKWERDREMTREGEIEEEQRVLREVQFCGSVMVPLLGAAYIQPPKPARINQEELKMLQDSLLNKRPAYRDHKEVKLGHVTIYPDYALLPKHLRSDQRSSRSSNKASHTSEDVYQYLPASYCVEIKPKQGWIPLMDRCYPKCTFCLTQYLKLSKGTVERISQYCPLDLFSGNTTRMKRALRALLVTPQNNLKLFRNGIPVYTDDTTTDVMDVLKEWFEPMSMDDSERLVEKFCCLVLHALMEDLTDGDILPSVESLPGPRLSPDETETMLPSSTRISSAVPLLGLSQSCDWGSQPLPSHCILDRILKIQKLEVFGSDAVYEMYRSVRFEENDYDYINKLSSNLPGKLCLDPIQRYLLATTAKDCSILIAFQQADRFSDKIPSKHTMVDIEGVKYTWNVGVSDLDPKPLCCIEKHRKRDTDVIHACADHLKSNEPESLYK